MPACALVLGLTCILNFKDKNILMCLSFVELYPKRSEGL